VLLVNLILHPGREIRTWQDVVRDAEVSCATTPSAEAELATPPSPDWMVVVPCDKLTE